MPRLLHGADRRDTRLLQSIQISPAFIKLILKKVLLSYVKHNMRRAPRDVIKPYHR
jgi:hypothetical protein